MQPVSILSRPGGMPRIRHAARFAMAIALALAVTTVPISQVAACSCGFPGYQEAIAAADVAFIGTVVAKGEPPLFGGDPMQTAPHAFAVTRSKTQMSSPFELEVAAGGGASCGLDMSVGEEWVVIASEWEGRLRTDLCTGSALATDLDPAELARIEDALSLNDPAVDSEEQSSPLDIPAPVIGILAAALLIGAAGFVAFRHGRVR